MKNSAGIVFCGLLMSFLLHLSFKGREVPEYEAKKQETKLEPNFFKNMKYRGVVYDVGLKYSSEAYSVEQFSPESVAYDMSVIADRLHANAVRIEGEDIARLVIATEAAHKAGLHVFFNPWKMNANADETVAYMKLAAIEAEKLRKKGINLVLVTGCEYSLFSKGVFPGETFNERVSWMITYGGASHDPNKNPKMQEASKKLNIILAEICKEIRYHFKGQLTYASGTWEDVDWNLYDIVGVDLYRRGEPAEEYVGKLERFKLKKPLIVMEVGSCAYEGAAEKGDGGFTILQGSNPDGTAIFAGGKVPVRSEKEQADYIETQVNLLNKAGVDAVFVFVFAFPVMPYIGEGNLDYDMASFSLVKSFPKGHPKTKMIPNWEKKEAFDRLSKVYGKMSDANH